MGTFRSAHANTDGDLDGKPYAGGDLDAQSNPDRPAYLLAVHSQALSAGVLKDMILLSCFAPLNMTRTL